MHVLLDWIGSQKIDDKMLASMREAGVAIELYRPLRWYHLARLNNRTHRKLLIVDGRVGLTGGVGIADKWGGHAQDEGHWRDSHYRAEGPVVAQMQATFLENWTKVSGFVLHGPGYFPAIEPAGDTRAQMFSSSPEGGADSMQLMYLLTITAAGGTIDLATAYFVPDDLTMNALLAPFAREGTGACGGDFSRHSCETLRSATRGPLDVELESAQPSHQRRVAASRIESSDAFIVSACGSRSTCNNDGLSLANARLNAGANSSVRRTVSPMAP